MAAARKTAAKSQTKSTDTVATVSTDENNGEIGISDELVQARNDALKAEADKGLKDSSGALAVDSEPQVDIDPELAKQREAALAAEKDRKTY